MYEIAKTWMLAFVLLACICTDGAAALKDDIDAIIRRTSQQNVVFSVQVVRADTGRVVYQHNASTPLIPASTMKLVTSAAALSILGADFQYVTQVGLAGDDLVIIGSGDPLLGDRINDERAGKPIGWVLDDIVQRLLDHGTTRIENIIVDSTVFDDERFHPSWPQNQLHRWYAAEVSGLNFYGNCVEILARNTGGPKAELTVRPATSYVTITNNTQVSTSGQNTIGFWRRQGSNHVIATGRCRRETAWMRITIDRPPAFFGTLIAERLNQAGIETLGYLVEKTAPERNVNIIATYSTPLADVLARCNKDSLGLAAECLMKTLGARASGGRGGSWESGRAEVARFLTSLGVSADEFIIDDGGGLSNRNRLSANALTRVLLSMYRTKDWPAIRDSLAVGGVDGTAARWFREPGYRGRILGKTGYIAGVK
ncbi:MAG TPA: D-alanyl-D-alanine carboxypeptidase/D-alanyl-D-alanine-endopeptidase, partial [Sedimentisphaerales bacterium]|nr:D-alanyl-D-alanine carboxypeptidase/D-alanyl-D-alanine-endopeptidase [Sedimentisphaerales bacterium]